MNRRVRMLALLLPVVAAAATFLAWSQPWVAIELVGGLTVVAAGDVAAPALPPFAIAALALVGALTLAGPVFRLILGLLLALLGLGIAASGAMAIGDPLAAAAVRLTEATGVEGVAALRPLVESSLLTIWPAVAIGAGAAAVVIGLGIAITASHWPERTRRYEATRYESTVPHASEGHTDRLDAWDALSDGDDPTTR